MCVTSEISNPVLTRTDGSEFVELLYFFFPLQLEIIRHTCTSLYHPRIAFLQAEGLLNFFFKICFIWQDVLGAIDQKVILQFAFRRETCKISLQ